MSTATTSELSGTPLAQEFEDIFNTNAQLVYRTAYAVTGSHEDAEDILQTIFLRLIRRPLRPELTENPKAYLYRAAVNLSLDTIRSRRRPIFIEAAERLELPAPTSDSVDDELY